MKSEIKQIELRDRATFIPMLAVKVVAEPGDYVLHRGGWLNYSGGVYFFRVDCSPAHRVTYEPFDWGEMNRTYRCAHEHINRHWEEIKSGDVVDVEFILGETDRPKQSEKLDHPL
jgi:hypothetical protein